MPRRSFIAVAASVTVCAALLILLRDADAENRWTAYAPEKDDVVRALVFGERPEDGADIGEGLYDWADYLNDFATDNSDVEVEFVPKSVCTDLLAHPACERDGFPTLFLNSTGEALFSEWTISEPQAYMRARLGLRGDPMPPDVAAYPLEAVTLK